jgi:hypothetical protein
LTLIDKNTHENPVFVGPSFIHLKKDEETYDSFFSFLKRFNFSKFQEKNINDLKCVGMDCDEAIRNAVKNVFPLSRIALCLNHLRSDVKKALKKFKISKNKIKKILFEIFGSIKKGREKSLVMSKNEKVFMRRFNKKSKNWNFQKVQKKGKISFKKWFETYKFTEMLEYVVKTRNKFLKSCKTLKYYTQNDIEGQNCQLKNLKCKKKLRLNDLISLLEEIADFQKNEIERAIYQSGKFMIAPAFKKFQCSPNYWFEQTEEKREKLVNDFQNTYLQNRFKKFRIENFYKKEISVHLKKSKGK